MAWLILGVILFMGIHLVPSFRGFRASLVSRLGESKFKGLFSIIALIGLVIIIIGKAKAGYHSLWQPPAWGRDVAILLMPVSFILLAAANMKSNIKRFTRHPMLWGVTLWSLGHLLANGDLASAVLFGAFGVFALWGMYSANLRGAIRQEKRYPITKDIITITAGVVGYIIFLILHPYLFGVPVINL